MKVLARLLVLLLFATPVYADSSFVAPSATGQAATGQIPGTATNDAAAAGNVGETGSNASNLTAVTTTVTINLATVTLQPGDYDVWGSAVGAATNATTSVQQLTASISLVSGTHSFTTGDFAALSYGPGIVTGNNAAIAFPTSVKTISLAVATPVYLTGSMLFTISTAGMKGQINWRRVR